MSQDERTGDRPLHYSGWHRRKSISRFIPERAEDLMMIDLDAVEYCKHCGFILAFIETVEGNGENYKATTVLKRVASECQKRPAFLVYYETFVSQETKPLKDIRYFRVKQFGGPSPWSGLRCFTPKEYAYFLWSLRNPPFHDCKVRAWMESQKHGS